ncbi:unnamed protein product [Adineta ricciae]|uniref:Isopenicillin N synthase-like Fe(2+) 2OG dioxygenase domain-containing protein n=1 Tax=Adineta ricciae TaxID=249248 RepID=A0A814MEE8_ADIRI|nr:unnamed protein product [Adineta ricciae]
MAHSSLNDRTIVEFTKLLLGDLEEVKRLQNEFESNGWCFMRLPDDNGQLTKKLHETQMNLETFFSQERSEKSKYCSSNGFGYSRVDHKESIRVLMDQYGFQKYDPPLTDNVDRTLRYLTILLDNLTSVIRSIISKMPIMAQSFTKTAVSMSHLRMLDIAHYFNERTGAAEPPEVGVNTDEVNCVPHFDPGLFSLSILSTCDGLQLKDRASHQWIDGPVNVEHNQHSIGVVWLGEAASILTENHFKAGIHRVVYPRTPHQSRIAIWLEVCTESQIELSLKQENEEDSLIPGGTIIQMDNQPGSLPVRARFGGERVRRFLRRMERERGLSLSKSATTKVLRLRHKRKRQLEEEQKKSTNNTEEVV